MPPQRTRAWRKPRAEPSSLPKPDRKRAGSKPYLSSFRRWLRMKVQAAQAEQWEQLEPLEQLLQPAPLPQMVPTAQMQAAPLRRILAMPQGKGRSHPPLASLQASPRIRP